MTQAEKLASTVREFTRDFPVECEWNERAFIGLKGFDSAMGMGIADAGYDETRPEELHVMEDQFEGEDVPEHEDTITMDDDDFKIMKIDFFPTKKNPLFYKFTLIKQN